MDKQNKKHVAGMGGIIAVLFIAPLIVFAVVYNSSERKNSFAPGSVDIKVNEGNGDSDEGEKLTKDYSWQQSDDKYIADKDVKIKDTRKYPGEMLRVMFVPMWYDSEDNVCAVFNFGNQPIRNGDAFTYTDGEKTIKLNMNSDWKKNGWEYQPNDGCFYYTGTLDNSELTAQLLDSVELNANAYALTENYVFRLDVLADAIQTSGNAAETRGWGSPQS
jgi:hypothetical protein